MSKQGITVIGSANVDFIMKVAALPARGETVTDAEYQQVFGGKGANCAVAAARAGGRVGFVACLGDDAFGRRQLANFAADGIDVADARLIPERPCGAALIMVDAGGDNYITVAPGTNDDLTPELIRALEPRLAGSAWVLLQMEIPVESNREILRLAARHGTSVLLNYAPYRGGILELSAAVTGLVLNEVEAACLSGLPVGSPGEALAAGAALRARGPGWVAVTLGADGVALATADGAQLQPAFPVTPVDTTAAGDTFCGALGCALAEGRALPGAVRFASAAAALSVTRLGAQPSIPRRAEIEAFLAERGVG